MPIEARPTPPPPESAPAAGATPGPESEPIERAPTPAERNEALGRIVRDTSAVAAAVRRCAAARLLPDQESVYDTATKLLIQTRAALGRDDLELAESLARKARQLALSLTCTR